jgi:hypothetical protein
MSETSWTDVWQIWISIATLVVTVIGLFAIWYQVKQSNRSQRVEVHNSTADSINELNQIIVTDDELLKANKETKEEVLCHLKLNRFEQLFVLHKEGLLDHDGWNSTIEWVRHSMSGDEMKRMWPSSKRFYRADFAAWVELLMSTNQERVVVRL